ncbi:phosphoribosylaminoimidazolesuccinocarboxamide synthase [Bacillus cereus group sp. MYBK108-2]|uniref:phosphoribosylaminoimidazolesuccinocarboxamide synthase n=1 Tax=Bacillus TaxID=1386 RepID=UPI000B4ADF43|nr:phosphoribosylaminoimidazolesuccinocarboxamide synthase [Bacillus cereus]HEF1900052.1 phosphoribosylaminoimidazolesuccinocarboxamide synthase [Bacillus cereus]
MIKNGLLYTCGKSKSMYYTEEDELLIMHFLDSVSSYTQNKNARIIGTGILRCEFSSRIFEMLHKKGMPNHYISNLGNGRMKVNNLDMIKLEVIPRNIAAGSIVRNFPIQHGQVFDPPILKLDLKYANDPMLNSDYILAMGVATKKELAVIRDLAFELNSILKEFFIERGVKLVDFKFEIGRDSRGDLMIGDEISPDGMRLWDIETNKSLDKDVFRYNKGDLIDAYEEVLKRIMPLESMNQ